jgi:hypothetical protein
VHERVLQCGEVSAQKRHVLARHRDVGQRQDHACWSSSSPELAAEGLKVNVIKHSHHDLELEPPRKDSARLRMAGAAEVMVASPFRVSIMRELRGAPEPSLEEQLEPPVAGRADLARRLQVLSDRQAGSLSRRLRQARRCTRTTRM